MKVSKTVRHTALLCLIVCVFALTGCNNAPELRCKNGTELFAQTWKLPLTDTSKVLSSASDVYALGSFDDSLIIRTDTIKYLSPADNGYEEKFGSVDQVIAHSTNPDLKELYRFENGAVYLLGYALGGESYTRFTPPLVLQSVKDAKGDTTKSKTENWSVVKNEFEKGQTTNSRVKLLKQGEINLNGTQQHFYEYKITISKDAKINYGDKGLIVPEAIMMESTVLYTEADGLIAEWGIRSKEKKHKKDKEEMDMPGRPEEDRDIYIEFTKYTKIK